jgi:hypothetical protein
VKTGWCVWFVCVRRRRWQGSVGSERKGKAGTVVDVKENNNEHTRQRSSRAGLDVSQAFFNARETMVRPYPEMPA